MHLYNSRRFRRSSAAPHCQAMHNCFNERGNHMKRIDGFRAIYDAAKSTEDGTRCMVAPHPKLQLEMQEALAQIRASATSNKLVANMIAAPEPRHPGLNNGMV